MKIRLCLLAVAFAAALSILYAEDGGIDGKWSSATEPARLSGSGAAGGGQAGCGNLGPRGSFPGGFCNDTGVGVLGIARPRATELNLSFDRHNGRLTGSIVFPAMFFGGGGSTDACGKLKIEEGRVTGRAMAFTTYRSVNGSRIPARWLGEISDNGALTLRTFDTLPCSTGRSTFSDLTGRPVRIATTAIDGDFLVYRRGDGSDNNKVPAGPAGKWWTTDNGRLTAVNLRLGSAGRLAGSVNVCGVSEMKIEEGNVIGRSITFRTTEKVNSIVLEQLWTGETVNERTLRLSSSRDTPCRYPTSTTLVFSRSR